MSDTPELCKSCVALDNGADTEPCRECFKGDCYVSAHIHARMCRDCARLAELGRARDEAQRKAEAAESWCAVMHDALADAIACEINESNEPVLNEPALCNVCWEKAHSALESHVGAELADRMASQEATIARLTEERDEARAALALLWEEAQDPERQGNRHTGDVLETSEKCDALVKAALLPAAPKAGP